MTNVLFVNASPRQENSAAVQAAQIFLENVSDANVTKLNLFEAGLPEYTPELALAKQSVMTGQALSDEAARQWRGVTNLVDQFLATDHFLFAVPMWNFSLPYKLKQYIDLITHPNLTFTMDKDGPRGIGQAGGTVIYSRGGDYSPKDGQPDPFDFQSPYMKTWCSLVGIDPVEEVLVQRTMAGPDAQAQAVQGASEQLLHLANAVNT